MPGIEVDAASEFIFGHLAGDPQLMSAVQGVYEAVAPENAGFPVVVFQQMSGTDLMEVGSFRIWSNLLYLVKVIGQTTSFADLKAAGARIDAVLHHTSGAVGDGTIWACIREQPFRMSELVQGINYRHSGGIYRLFTT